MRFIHTSDLHIGKRLAGISLINDQIYILDKIIQTAVENNADAIIVAGDIYDKADPSAEAVSVFEKFLLSAYKKGLEVYISAGNHDSEARLSFGRTFFEGSGIHISKPFGVEPQKYKYKDAFGTVNIYMLPYIKPFTASKIFNDEIKTYETAVKRAIAELNCNTAERNILIAHQFVVDGDTDPETCESENMIGGIERVGFEVFNDFDYTALGHIHKPQKIGRESIRYSGTPLKYSLSEKNHKKSVCLVEIKEKGDVTTEKIPLEPIRDLREITGAFEDIYKRKTGFKEGGDDDYIFITLTDENMITGVKSSLSAIYKNIVHISYKTDSKENFNIDVLGDEGIKLGDIELFGNFFEKRANKPLSDIQKSLIAEIISDIGKDGEEDAT